MSPFVEQHSSVTLVTVPLVTVLLLLSAVPVTVVVQQKEMTSFPVLLIYLQLNLLMSYGSTYEKHQFGSISNARKWSVFFFFPSHIMVGENAVFVM